MLEQDQLITLRLDIMYVNLESHAHIYLLQCEIWHCGSHSKQQICHIGKVHQVNHTTLQNIWIPSQKRFDGW